MLPDEMEAEKNRKMIVAQADDPPVRQQRVSRRATGAHSHPKNASMRWQAGQHISHI